MGEAAKADAMVVAVAHRQFRRMGAETLALKIAKGGWFIDVKSVFDRKALRGGRTLRLAPVTSRQPAMGEANYAESGQRAWCRIRNRRADDRAAARTGQG